MNYNAIIAIMSGINLFSRLSLPFPASRLDWRIGRKTGNGKGFMFPYVTSRGIMERLDDVFGVDGWSASYTAIEGGFLCTLNCCVDKEKNVWVSKQDGAGRTDIESIKGGISGALKRAAVAWGIGRYLYDLPQVLVDLDDGKYFKGKIVLPDDSLPEEERTGNNEIKVLYDNHAPDMTYEEASVIVLEKDKFNAGKKMRDIPTKSLQYLANSKFISATERAAAKIVYEQRTRRES